MAGFTSFGPSWHVEDLSDERYPVFVLWDEKGKVVLGVAGDDGIEELVEAKAIDAAKLGATEDVEIVVSFCLGKINPPLRASSLRGKLSLLEAKLRRDKDGWKILSMRERRR